jgi:hypothetical protein
MNSILKLGVVLLLLASATQAQARPVRFLGPHPIAGKHGHGYCYIEAPHLHDYPPDHQALYQQVDGAYVFTGDPTPFGYDGDRHRFQGHHPVVVDGVVEPVYCVIDGPHVHEYAPPPGPDFVEQNGVAVYVAPIPPVYVAPHRVRVVNAEYRPLLVASQPGVSVEINAPGIVVGAPPPVVVAPPTVVIEPPHPVVFAPPAVVVEPPHPVFVAPRPVVVGAPGAVYVGGPRYEHEHEGWGHRDDEGDQGWGHHDEGRGHWEHHDNGRHNGWHK